MPLEHETETVPLVPGTALMVGDYVLVNGEHVYKVVIKCATKEEAPDNPARKGTLHVVNGVSRSIQTAIPYWSNMNYVRITKAQIEAVTLQNRHKGQYQPPSVSKGMTTSQDFMPLPEEVRTLQDAAELPVPSEVTEVVNVAEVIEARTGGANEVIAKAKAKAVTKATSPAKTK